MKREDFFTGEPLPNGSPSIHQNIISEQEAVSNASFGKYDYDPGTRMMMSQPVSIYPGGYGYNTNFMNPPIGIGSIPYGYYGNPALQYQQQMAYQQQMMQSNQQIQYYINPINFGGEYLPPLNFEDEIEKLKMEYWEKEQEVFVQENVTNSQNPYFGMYNYYGVPYYNPFRYNSLNSEINKKIEDIKNEARENRINFNISIAKLAHNIAGDIYDEKELEERYRGKYVESPGYCYPSTYLEVYNQNRFNNLVPFDNSQFYREQSIAVSKEFNSMIPEDANLKECFAGMGVVNAHYEMEEESHRRRDKGALYNSNDNSYKYFVRAKVAERYNQNNGSTIVKSGNNEQLKQNVMGSFPTLSQSAQLLDDGTLNITCNFGSRAGQIYSVHNSQEAGYEQDRERFNSFINSIPKSIYLDSPNPTS